jgi:hypothetical protein
LTLQGSFTNNASFTHNGGTVILAGAAQTIGGSSATTFNNLTLNGATTTKTFATTGTTISGSFS